MILYQECKRLDKVKGQQKVVEGKLRDQCMLCDFYEMCNSCFFFGSSNAEKEAAIAAMVNDAIKEPVINTRPQHHEIIHNEVTHKSYEDSAQARREALMRKAGR